MTFPLVSRSSIVPVTTYGPFGLASIVTSAPSNPPSSADSVTGIPQIVVLLRAIFRPFERQCNPVDGFYE